MPDELWLKACDIVQETGIKTIHMEKKCKKAKWFSEEALQIAVKTREAKSKGEKERYTDLEGSYAHHYTTKALRYTDLNAEFQGIARGAKKAFLKNQCKEI